MSQEVPNNNEIITFDTNNINLPSNKKQEINIDEILEKEKEILKQNKYITKNK